MGSIMSYKKTPMRNIAGLVALALFLCSNPVAHAQREQATLLTQPRTAGSGDGELNGPNDVTVDAAGNIYVADGSNHRIQKFNSEGVFLATWGSRGSGNGEFINPHR